MTSRGDPSPVDRRPDLRPTLQGLGLVNRDLAGKAETLRARGLA